MTRGDVRLLVAIIVTALLSSMFTIVISRRLAPPPPPTTIVSAPDRAEATRDNEDAAMWKNSFRPDRIARAERRVDRAIDRVDRAVDDLDRLYDHARPRPHGTGFFQSGNPDATPGLDRSAIRKTLTSLDDQFRACTTKDSRVDPFIRPWRNAMTVSVDVARDGSVTKAEATHATDAAVGACVATAIEHATFPTTEGGRFTTTLRL